MEQEASGSVNLAGPYRHVLMCSFFGPAEDSTGGRAASGGLRLESRVEVME